MLQRRKILGRKMSFTLRYIEISKHFLKYHTPPPPCASKSFRMYLCYHILHIVFRSRLTFCWSSSRFKLFAKGYWQTTKLSIGMQRVITGKYFSVQYIVSYRNIHAYAYPKYSDTLNTFNMLCPLKKAKVIFKGSS